MRKNSWLQKFLYFLMAILGAYIIYKSGCLLALEGRLQKASEDGNIQRSLEDSAMRTWASAYTAAVEGKEAGNIWSLWMSQIAPVFSYAVDQAETGNETDTEGMSSLQAENEADTEEMTALRAESETDMEGMTALQTEDETELEATAAQAEAAIETETVTHANDMTEAQAEDTGTVKSNGTSNEMEETQTESIETAVEDETAGSQERSAETETMNGKEAAAEETPAQETMADTIFAQALPQLSEYSYLLSNLYTVDADTYTDAELLDAEKLLFTDLSIEQDDSVPQILIYHTHSQEAFADSVEGEVSDTIVGMGEILADELRSYGYNVIHDTGVYDLVDGVLDRSAAYDYAREAVMSILEEYPTIEVVIDLHRDGVSGEEGDFVTEIDGESVSKIMFFNGLSRDENGDEISWLPNSYLSENLAFSLQLQVLANAEYPGFTRKIYLKEERYNLHLRARSLLIEAGTQLNTVEEEQRAMAPLANLIRQVLEM
ncbi:MAG: stage II sporulation protein P [Clostridiales bacterium]|nr:stage II sporulation protein P [Clostridiales bacterium]